MHIIVCDWICEKQKYSLSGITHLCSHNICGEVNTDVLNALNMVFYLKVSTRKISIICKLNSRNVNWILKNSGVKTVLLLKHIG